MSDVGCQMSAVRCRTADVSTIALATVEGRRAESRKARRPEGQRADVSRQMSDVGRQMSDVSPLISDLRASDLPAFCAPASLPPAF